MLESDLAGLYEVMTGNLNMRTFVKLRDILATHKDLARKVEEHDRQIGALLSAVQKLLASPEPSKKYL